jgi:ribonuclease BN (tRNA processing enzyme)
MSLTLAFLGTGTCNSTPRNPSSLALSNGEAIVCVDFGGGAYHQLSRLDHMAFSYKNLESVFLTHFHVDHVSGLPDLLWGEMWDRSGRREDTLVLGGPHGLGNFYEQRLLPFMGDYPVPFGVKLVELAHGGTHSGSFYRITSHALAHGEYSTGYLVEAGGVRIAITGDTGWSEGLARLFAGADIAVMEWGITGDDAYSGHLNTPNVLQLLRTGSLPPRVYVTHIYPEPGLERREQLDKMRRVVDEYPVRFEFPDDSEIVELES